MKVIAFEEHYKLPAISEEQQKVAINSGIDLLKQAGYGGTGPQGEWPPGINDLGEGRIAAMDAAGVDVQILSHSVPGPETLEPSVAAALSTQANDAVAGAVAKHPDRFRGFATLPMRDPTAAAGELERVVREHGFVGALINGHVDGRYLDDTFFWPVFECAEQLGVPVYLHPTVPPQPVIDAYYRGFGAKISARLSAAGVGWHIDTGIHCLRLILGGVFDRFPRLQIIVGHHFEALSWMGWRADYSFPVDESGLRRTIKEYLRENFYGGILAGDFFTHDPGTMDPSWSLSYNAYLAMVNVIGIDRIVFTADYPYGNMKAARQFFDQMPINLTDKEKIAHLNAERLLGL
jgi:predicted TIM-barrel fold metal-dependent hydrolase